jgi:hypothetical protein
MAPWQRFKARSDPWLSKHTGSKDLGQLRAKVGGVPLGAMAAI